MGRVLVVDDEAGVRESLRMLLKDECEVVTAGDVTTALRLLEETPPDLVLLDLIMPQLDGFGFLAQLRKNSLWREIPVAVLTAMDIGPEERARLNGGVERVLEKGALDLDQLRDEIQSLTRLSLRA